mgnify:CR=1 FL=1
MTEHRMPYDRNNVVRGVLSPACPDLFHIGLGEIAYVRHMIVDGIDLYRIFAANGELLATMNNRESAMAAIVQNDLIPASLN